MTHRASEILETPARRQFAWAWILLLVCLPYAFSGSIYDGALLPRLAGLQLFLAAGFLWLALRLPRAAPICPPSPLALPIAVFLLLTVVSIHGAVNRTESVLQMSQYVCLAALVLLAHCTIDPPSLSRVVRFAAWAGLPVAILGIAQYLGVPLPLLDRIPTRANPSATFFHRNAAAEYLIAVIPLAWVGLKMARTRARAIAQAGLLVLLTVFLVYTRARGAWLGLVMGLAAAVAASWLTRPASPSPGRNASNWRFRAAVAVLSVLLVILLGRLPENMQRTGAQHFDEKKADPVTAAASILAEGGDRGRLRTWSHTWDMITDNPWGVGLGNWQYRFPAYARGDQVNVVASPSRPHNDYLWLASEIGWIGLLAYLALLFVAARMALILLKSGNATARTLTQAFIILLCAHLVDALFNFPRERISAAVMFWFSLGGLSVLYADHKGASAGASCYPGQGHRAAAVAAIPVVALSVLITLVRCDYDRHHLRVFAAERIGDWETILEEAPKALRHGVLRPNTAVAYGRALWRSGDLAGAERAYRSALEKHPNSLNAHNNLATVLRQSGDPAGAVTSLRAALELLPGFPQALNNLGLAYRDLGRLSDAASVLETAARALPNTAEVYCNLGDVYRLQGDLNAARRSYQRARAIRPDYPRALHGLRTLEASRGVTGE